MTSHDCPHCKCDLWEKPPQPSTSSVWARKQALEAAETAVRAARERRTTAVPSRARQGNENEEQ